MYQTKLNFKQLTVLNIDQHSSPYNSINSSNNLPVNPIISLNSYPTTSPPFFPFSTIIIIIISSIYSQYYNFCSTYLYTLETMRKLLVFFKLPDRVVNYLSPYTFGDYREALCDNHLEQIQVVLGCGIKVTSQDQNVLMEALNYGNQDTVCFLIEKFRHLLNFKRRNEKGDTALMVAIFRKMPKVIKILIPLSQLSACDFNKNTPFIAAAANGDIATLQLLMHSEGCNPEVKNYEGQTALHRACYFGEIRAVDWLICHTNLKIGEKDKKGNNCVHLACMGAQLAVSRYLMDKMKDSKSLLIQNYQGKTPSDLIQTILKLIKQSDTKKVDINLYHLKT